MAWIERLLSATSRTGSTLRRMTRVGRYCAENLGRDRAAQMAAALGFHTVFSLLPMLALMLVVLQAFSGIDQYRDQMQAAIMDFALPDTLVSVEDEPEAEGDAEAGKEVDGSGSGEAADTPKEDVSVKGLVAPIAGSTSPQIEAQQAEFTQAREQLAERVGGFLDSLAAINFGGIGIIGLLIFIYGATALLATIERSFNAILRFHGGRPWYRSLPLYYTVVTLGPLVIIAGQVLQSRMIDWLAHSEWTAWIAWLAGPLIVLSPLVTTWLVFFLMFVLLPSARVPIRPAAVGAGVSAVLWVVGKELFSLYVANAGLSTLYGAVALVPLFLLWLWLTWMIVLFGLEVTEALRSFKEREMEEKLRRSGDKPVVEASAYLLLAARIASAFSAGETCALHELSLRVGISPQLLPPLLELLESAGIIRQTGDSSAPSFTLARPAANILLNDILDAARSESPDPGDLDEKARALLDRLRHAERQSLANISLAELL